MTYQLLQGDCIEVLKTLPAGCVHTCVTSPPYFGLRDYGVAGQIGLESTVSEYVDKMVQVFRGVRRVLRDDGTVWLNLGDSYAGNGTGAFRPGNGRADGNVDAVNNIRNRNGNGTPEGLKPKDLIGIPWRVAFALQADGWYLRSDIIWHKPNPMPESVTDRPTKSHEYLFLLAKSERYFYDAQAIAEPITQSSIERISQPTFASQTGGSKDYRNGINPNRSMRQTLENFAGNGSATRNKRSVWTVATRPYKEAHFATYPVELVQPCILAGCPAGGTVLDPFNGSGTTGVAAIGLGRQYIGIEINPEYIRLAERRLGETQPALLGGAL